MADESFRVAVPLSDFPWSGDFFGEFSDIAIKTKRPDLRELDDDLATDEKRALRSTAHWLTFDWSLDAKPSPGEVTNLFLLALWLVKPTKTHAKVRFHINKDPQSQHLGQFTRIFTRFSWIEGYVRNELTDKDLKRAARYYGTLLDIARANGRLYQALVLHAAGCWASHWHVSFICHSAAAEALLTYATGHGITKRLSKSFACLTRRSTAARNSAFRRFSDLYSIRSDINHGRTRALPVSVKLRSLGRLESALRDAWRVILASARTRSALEGTDAQRQAFFAAMEVGYTPPP